MTRSTAREIAIHLAYQLSFTELPVEEFLDQQLSDERFAELAAEDDLYADRPNTKQEAYIRRLVSGVAEHAAELDADIEKYARGWRFERFPCSLRHHACGHVRDTLHGGHSAGRRHQRGGDDRQEVRNARGRQIHQRYSGQLRPGRGQGKGLKTTHERQGVKALPFQVAYRKE